MSYRRVLCRACKRDAGTNFDCPRCALFRQEFDDEGEKPSGAAIVKAEPAVASRETHGEKERRCERCGVPSGELDLCLDCIDKDTAHLQGPAKGIAKAAKIGWAFLTREE